MPPKSYHDFARITGDTLEVTTKSATSVQSTKATLNGNLDNKGDAASVYCNFEYREQGNATWQETAKIRKTTNGKFEEKITGLNSSTTYEFRAKGDATDGDVATGEIKTFTTT